MSFEFQNNGYESVWSEPHLVLKMLQAEEQRRLEAEEFQRHSAFQGLLSPVVCKYIHNLNDT